MNILDFFRKPPHPKHAAKPVIDVTKMWQRQSEITRMSREAIESFDNACEEIVLGKAEPCVLGVDPTQELAPAKSRRRVFRRINKPDDVALVQVAFIEGEPGHDRYYDNGSVQRGAAQLFPHKFDSKLWEEVFDEYGDVPQTEQEAW